MSPHAFGSGEWEFGLEGGGMRKRCWRTTELDKRKRLDHNKGNKTLRWDFE